MELILLEGDRKRLDLRCNSWLFILIAATVLGSVLALAYYLGEQSGLSETQNRMSQFHDDAGSLWESELALQRAMVSEARTDAEKHLDAMASRVSNLQSHVLRLNALGSRLAKMAELDEIEFDNPGVGGPAPSLAKGNSVPDFLDSLDQLALEIRDRQDKLEALESLLINRTLESRTLPQGSPLQKGWISSTFGWRTDPITGKKEFHDGIDFAGRSGSEVTAAGAGIVTWSDKRYGFGNLVEIDHGNGYVTRYAHNKENLVTVGDRVEKGQPIAIIGSTGRSTGLHVHFEVLHNGKRVNPKQFIVTRR